MRGTPALLSREGFTLIEALVTLAVISIIVLAIAGVSQFPERTHRKGRLISSVLSLESRLLSALQNQSNFNSREIRARMQDGTRLPALSLKDLQGNVIASYGPSARQLSAITASTSFFTLDLIPCSGFDGSSCLIRLDSSLIMVGGPVQPRTGEAPPEWIPPGSPAEQASRFPLYGLAYRIVVDPSVDIPMRPRGVAHLNQFTPADHKWIVPYESYIIMTGSQSCRAGGFVAGIDPDTREAICLNPEDMCSSSTLIAKQLKIVGNSIGVECAPWKSFRCPDDYVVQWIAPSMFDSDRNGVLAPAPNAADYGVCVYIGKDVLSRASTHPTTATIQCPPKYDAVGTCSITNVVTTPCTSSTATPASVPPNAGTVSPAQTSSTEFSCQLTPPSMACPTSYSGGSWTAQAQATGTCVLRADERLRPMEIQ